MKKKGVIYAAFGENFVHEAKESARSLKEKNNIHVTLFTNKECKGECFDEIINVEIDRFDWDVKIKCISESPYRKSVFLDTDTIVLGSIENIFRVLDEFQIAAAQAPIHKNYPIKDVPVSFPEHNTGVLAYRKSNKTNKLFSEWMEHYRKHKNIEGVHGQVSFRDVLYKSSLRFTTLPASYNMRLPYPSYVNGKVSIIHGKSKFSGVVSRLINMSRGPRVFFPPFIVISQGNPIVRVLSRLKSIAGKWI